MLLGGDLHAVDSRLLGDAPATGDGLFVSDHYGLVADIAVGGDAPSAVLDAAPGTRTALVWLPPEELRTPLQRLRERRDPDADRWPPHVALLSGFVPEADFEAAAPLLAEAAATVAPFEVRLSGTGVPDGRGRLALRPDPVAPGTGPWQALHAALLSRFPRCGDGRRGFTPHLVLGRAADPRRSAAGHADGLPEAVARVGELVLLSRRGEEPMRPRAAVALGSGQVRWLDDPPPRARRRPRRGRGRARRGAAGPGPARRRGPPRRVAPHGLRPRRLRRGPGGGAPRRARPRRPRPARGRTARQQRGPPGRRRAQPGTAPAGRRPGRG
ncbi:2'-5' RNA ligase family protein, partial [Thermobifida cellulosilytica]|uniref:2'-5' RNA ligase family protein n=1 Tax=Thermobifida cellulosilytica TaxID=144786 RepID=UPI0018DEC9E3